MSREHGVMFLHNNSESCDDQKGTLLKTSDIIQSQCSCLIQLTTIGHATCFHLILCAERTMYQGSDVPAGVNVDPTTPPHPRLKKFGSIAYKLLQFQFRNELLHTCIFSDHFLPYKHITMKVKQKNIYSQVGDSQFRCKRYYSSQCTSSSCFFFSVYSPCMSCNLQLIHYM